MNRAAKRATLFEQSEDYDAFVEVLGEAVDRFAIALFAYCIMRNHWHLVLSPRSNGALSRFMHWLTTTHARRWQTFRGLDGQGAVYQGRFKDVPVCDDEHFLWVCRYVERNPVRATLVDSGADWKWSSLSQRIREESRPRLAEWPVPIPLDWTTRVNIPQSEAEAEAVRRAIRSGVPLGRKEWSTAVSAALGIVPRKPRGRPRKPGSVSSKNDSRPHLPVAD
jgi:putative transposase